MDIFRPALYIYDRTNLTLKETREIPFPSPWTKGPETQWDAPGMVRIKIPKGETIVIDFNQAYNPYCAYSTGWNCPIPPDENHLKTEITAGVKDWKEH